MAEVMQKENKKAARSLLCLIFVSSLVVSLTACGGQSSASSGPHRGCVQEGKPGWVLPETSGLTCSEINQMIQATPSEAGGFLLEGKATPGVLWKCRQYGAGSPRLLLRCIHERRRFSVVPRAAN